MNFEFLQTPKIHFGVHQFERFGAITKDLGSRLFIVANESALSKSLGIMKTLENSAAENQSELAHYIVKGEPTIESVDSGVEKALEFNPDVVIGIGGGSALDSSKAIASLVMNAGSAKDYMEAVGKGAVLTNKPLPIIAVPTTAGTGSEVTKNAVIHAKKDQVKASIRSSLMVPTITIVDPILMVSVPPAITAICGMDALTQLIEAYTSNKSNPVTDALAILGIKNAFNSLLTCYQNGSSLKAREQMALAAILSGICLANVGLGAVHGFASPLGGLGFPHGAICAALLLPTIEMNIDRLTQERPINDKLEIIQKYANIGGLISGNSSLTVQENCTALLEYLNELTQKLQIQSLSKYGLTERDFPSILEKAKNASSMRYNPVFLDDEALITILRRGLI